MSLAAVQVLVLFIYNLFAGSVYDNFTSITRDLSRLSSVLGAAIPRQAGQQVNYILTLGLGTQPVFLLRIPGLVIYFILTRMAATERAKKRVWHNQVCITFLQCLLFRRIC